jgi:acyl carrier protein
MIFDVVCDILEADWDISREQVGDGSIRLEDVGLDSLDLLNLIFALEQRTGSKLPVDDWIRQRNEGAAEWEDMTLLHLCHKVDQLVSSGDASQQGAR